VIRNDGLSDGCPDGVNLSGDTSTLHSDADIEVGELVLSEDKNWFEDLQSHDFGLDVLDRLSIDLDETPSLFGKGHGGGRLLPRKARTRKEREKRKTWPRNKLTIMVSYETEFRSSMDRL